MNYKDFYKRFNTGKQDLYEDIDPKQLELGAKEENSEHDLGSLSKKIAADHLRKNKDYYKIAHKAGLEESSEDTIANILGMTIDGGNEQPADELDAITSMPDQCSDDKEKKIAAGKVDNNVVNKSVGGSVVPGEGQKQGGNNTKGSIAKTPKMGNSSENISSGEMVSIELQENSNKNLINKLIKEVLNEMSPGLPAFKVIYNDGEYYVTSMAKEVTLDMARKYFIGNEVTMPDEVTKKKIVDVQQVSGGNEEVKEEEKVCPKCRGNGGGCDFPSCRNGKIDNTEVERLHKQTMDWGKKQDNDYKIDESNTLTEGKHKPGCECGFCKNKKKFTGGKKKEDKSENSKEDTKKDDSKKNPFAKKK